MNVFCEMKIFVNHKLTEYAQLMIHFLVSQLPQGLFSRDDAFLIILNGINHIIVCNTAFHHVIFLREVFTLATIHHILKPFNIISVKFLEPDTIRQSLFLVKMIDTDNGDYMPSFPPGYYNRPSLSLSL